MKDTLDAVALDALQFGCEGPQLLQMTVSLLNNRSARTRNAAA